MLHIEFARRSRKWTQAQLSEATRIDQNFISRIERGQGLPIADQRQRLADALGISPEILTEPVVPTTPTADNDETETIEATAR